MGECMVIRRFGVLPKLVVMSIIVVALFLLLGAGHFNSENVTQSRSLTEPTNVGPKHYLCMV